VLLMIVATVSATAAVAQVSYSQQGAVAPGASSFSASRKLLFTASKSGNTVPVRRASLNVQRRARDSGGGGVVWRRTPKGANKLRGAPPSVGGLDWKDAVRTPVCLINASSCGVHTSLTTDGATGGRRRDGTGFTTLHVMEVKRRSAGCWQLASLAMRLQSSVKRRFMLQARAAIPRLWQRCSLLGRVWTRLMSVVGRRFTPLRTPGTVGRCVCSLKKLESRSVLCKAHTRSPLTYVSRAVMLLLR